MKHFYLILIAIFTLLSCSNDDGNSDDENQEINSSTTYTLELNATEELEEIKVHLKMSSEQILETFSVTNTSSISVDFTKDDGSIISAEIIDSSPTPSFRYKIFAKCNGEVVALILDKGQIGKGMSEFTAQLETYNCENF